MRIRPAIVSLNALKKDIYTILRKYHKLEKKKNLTKFYSKKYKDDYYIVLILKHIANVLQLTTEFNNNPLGKTYIEKFEVFYSKVNTYADSESRINRAELVSILKLTTKIFNTLLGQKVKAVSNEEIHNEWTKCIRANFTVWGNH